MANAARQVHQIADRGGRSGPGGPSGSGLGVPLRVIGRFGGCELRGNIQILNCDPEAVTVAKEFADRLSVEDLKAYTGIGGGFLDEAMTRCYLNVRFGEVDHGINSGALARHRGEVFPDLPVNLISLQRAAEHHGVTVSDPEEHSEISDLAAQVG